jgi:hypothetical protein
MKNKKKGKIAKGKKEAEKRGNKKRKKIKIKNGPLSHTNCFTSAHRTAKSDHWQPSKQQPRQN